jgi:hypothetical protein
MPNKKQSVNKIPIYRHGDISFVPIPVLPSGLTPKNGIIAEGEISGHLHAFADTTQVSCFIDTVTQQQFVQVIEPSVIDHPEHGPLEIPVGTYTVRRSRELDLVGTVRQTMD